MSGENEGRARALWRRGVDKLRLTLLNSSVLNQPTASKSYCARVPLWWPRVARSQLVCLLVCTPAHVFRVTLFRREPSRAYAESLSRSTLHGLTTALCTLFSNIPRLLLCMAADYLQKLRLGVKVRKVTGEALLDSRVSVAAEEAARLMRMGAVITQVSRTESVQNIERWRQGEAELATAETLRKRFRLRQSSGVVGALDNMFVTVKRLGAGRAAVVRAQAAAVSAAAAAQAAAGGWRQAHAGEAVDSDESQEPGSRMLTVGRRVEAPAGAGGYLALYICLICDECTSCFSSRHGRLRVRQGRGGGGRRASAITDDPQVAGVCDSISYSPPMGGGVRPHCQAQSSRGQGLLTHRAPIPHAQPLQLYGKALAFTRRAGARELRGSHAVCGENTDAPASRGHGPN